jgi:hypothetical protein
MIASEAAEASSSGDLHLVVDEHSVDVGERHVNSKGNGQSLRRSAPKQVPITISRPTA